MDVLRVFSHKKHKKCKRNFVQHFLGRPVSVWERTYLDFLLLDAVLVAYYRKLGRVFVFLLIFLKIPTFCL